MTFRSLILSTCFHGWIQASDGVYHDVADYSHMRAGPGIVLVASHANLSIDEANNRRGLLYSQKAHLSGSNEEKIRAVLRAALKYCRHLEQEPTLRSKLKFSDEEIFISINDRLLCAEQPGDAYGVKAGFGKRRSPPGRRRKLYART